MTATQLSYAAELAAAGLLLPSGVAGVVGQGPVFVDLRERVDAAVSRSAAAEQPERMEFPPVMPRERLEAGGYLRSFPHLAGSVFSFIGGERDALEQAELAAQGQDWSRFQGMTDLVLTPAACHPVYPAVAARGVLPEAGVTADPGSAFVFRHEPSPDPARLQAFHMRELVRIARPAEVGVWRDAWRDRAGRLLATLGLEVTVEEANDPFFGRSGRLMAANQREQALKWELVVPIAGPEPTAVASFNCHRGHFSALHDLRFADGTAAHSACLGFGLERVVLALLRVHGLEPADWPAAVRAVLWP